MPKILSWKKVFLDILETGIELCKAVLLDLHVEKKKKIHKKIFLEIFLEVSLTAFLTVINS